MNEKQLLERAEAAEDGLREIALFLSVGGYNDDGPMDVTKYVQKIKYAIVHPNQY